jgi:hypothetical protein
MEIKSEQLWSVVKPRLRMYIGHTWDLELVAKTTGSTVPTVTGWLADQVPPGERLIKLWHLLAASGIDSPELDGLPAFNAYCGKLLMLGVVDIKELMTVCHLANPQGVLSVLRGTPPMHPQFTAHELQELYGDEVQTRLHEITRVDTKKTSAPPQAPSRAPSALHAVSPATVTVLAAHLEAVLPLVRLLNSDACSAEDRSRLRSLIGNDEMFELSNVLNNLCSERARNHGRTGQ